MISEHIFIIVLLVLILIAVCYFGMNNGCNEGFTPKISQQQQFANEIRRARSASKLRPVQQPYISGQPVAPTPLPNYPSWSDPFNSL